MLVISGGSDTIGQLVIHYANNVMAYRGGNVVGRTDRAWTTWNEVIDRTRFNPCKIQSGAPATDVLWAY